MKLPTTLSWIPEVLAATTLACSAGGTAPGGALVSTAGTAATVDCCAEARARLPVLRRELLAGRLLRALPPSADVDPACPDVSRQIAAVALEAAAGLGDVEAVKAWGRTLPGTAAPPPFHPDRPAAALAADAEAVYARAVAAYLADRWADAGALGLAVGASGGGLAPEGFILAARAAEHAGDPARAARMWARAYRVGCAAGAGCVVQLPREDLFGRTALVGRFVPWYGEMLCSAAIHATTGVVNGTWHVTPRPSPPSDAAPEALDVREIPSRVLLDRVDAPPGVDLVCFSPDGRHRVGVAPAPDGKRSIVFGAMGRPWGQARVAGKPPEARDTLVANDGRVIVRNELGFEVFHPDRHASRDVIWPEGVTIEGANVGELGHLYAVLKPKAGGAAPKTQGLARYDLDTGKVDVSRTPFRADELGPVDAGNHVVLRSDERFFLVDGLTHAVLGEVGGPVLSVDPGNAGLVRSASLLWSETCEGRACFRAVSLTSGARETVELSWHPPRDEARAVEAASQALRGLPVGSPARTWGSFPGWSVSRSLRWIDAATHVEVPVIEVKAGGRAPLRVVLGSDQRGAIVVAEDGRFELVGSSSAAFRASASCGERGAHTPPAPSDRAWPLEVCAAALEEPDLSLGWLTSPNDTATSPKDAGAPPPPARR